MVALLVLCTSILLGGCRQDPSVNPSFRITRDQATVELKKIENHRVKLDRPLVILGGFGDIGVGPAMYERMLKLYIEGTVVRVTFFDTTQFDQCRRRVAAVLDRRLGKSSETETIEVDVIGQSMGGLVAIYSALDDPALGKRLKIRNLYTISSPLQGAKMALWTPFNVFGFQKDMRPGSDLYKRLAATTFDFPVYSYTRLDDGSVGEAYASLPGRGVWWVDNPPMERAHIGVFRDRRVLLDIVRRLRKETPVTTEPPAPLPATQPAAVARAR